MDVRKNDILLGRGPLCYRHPGNVKFRILIRSQVDKYNVDAPRSTKQGIVRSLIKVVHEEGYRFLVRAKNKCNWNEAHPRVVQSKVCHALRDARNHKMSIMTKNHKEQQQQQQQQQQKTTTTTTKKKKMMTMTMISEVFSKIAGKSSSSHSRNASTMIFNAPVKYGEFVPQKNQNVLDILVGNNHSTLDLIKSNSQFDQLEVYAA
jgi:hypothetical protein